MQNVAKQVNQLPDGIFSKDGVVDALTFQLCNTRYAIPISQVRYIEQITKSTRRVDTQHGPFEVTDYQGKTVHVIDFAELTHGHSSHKDNAALVTQLEQREQDHVDWLDALEESVKTGVAFTKATDPHQCAFGKWYDHFAPDDEILADIMKDFDAPHKRIHSLAEKLLGLVAQNEKAKALNILEKERNTTLIKLRNLFDVARDRIKTMTRPVFVFVCNKRNGLVALRLDAIDDIILFDQKHYAHYDSMPGTSGKDLPIFAGYLSEDGQNHMPYILLDWRQYDR
ncbi:MAG: chemotaxis protein CheW [Pseudomonadales bacterium]|nr:chemotaxis protein CheW [Pseudomonadales bacterium]